MYKVEIKPGVGFSKPFSTRIEALIFIKDFQKMCTELGIVPFRCEVVRIPEIRRKRNACNEESGAADEEDAGGAMREISEGGV